MQFQDQDATIQPQDEDNDPPFSLPDPPVSDNTDDSLANQGDSDRLDPTHPATDSAEDIDAHEEYDEGLSGAAEAEEPNAGNAVKDYDPDQDQRKPDQV